MYDTNNEDTAMHTDVINSNLVKYENPAFKYLFILKYLPVGFLMILNYRQISDSF